MAKNNISKEFNAFAGKIVNMQEVNDLFGQIKLDPPKKEQGPKGIKRVFKTAVAIITFPAKVVMFPIRVYRGFKDIAEYARRAADHPVTYYISKDKKEAALAALAKNGGSPESQENILEAAVGKDNVYVDAQNLFDVTRVISPFSKSLAKQFERAIAHAKDYREDVKTGKIVVLPQTPGV